LRAGLVAALHGGGGGGARRVQRLLLGAEARVEQSVVGEQLAQHVDAIEQLAQALRREDELRGPSSPVL